MLMVVTNEVYCVAVGLIRAEVRQLGILFGKAGYGIEMPEYIFNFLYGRVC